MGLMMDAREERIRAKAHELWEVAGKPEGRDREHWDQAAKLVDEEQRQEARGQSNPEAGEHPGDPSVSDDPIGITLAAMKRP